MKDDELQQVIEKSKCGDHHYFEELILSYYPLLHRYVACRINDRMETDDIMQDILLIVWLNINKLRDAKAFKSWLLRIASNCCNKWYKSKSTYGLPTDTDILTSLMDNKYSIIEGNEINFDLELEIEKLPLQQRQIIEEFYFKELKISEIAFVHNLPIGTVKRRLHDSRTVLRKSLEKLM